MPPIQSRDSSKVEKIVPTGIGSGTRSDATGATVAGGAPTVRLVAANDGHSVGANVIASGIGYGAIGPDPVAPNVRLAYGAPITTTTRHMESPVVRLAHEHGAQGTNVLMGRNGVDKLPEESKPALLVSYYYLEQFLKNRHRYHYRDWVMDSGAFSAHNSGVKIELSAYIDCCKQQIVEDSTLVEIYSLDVIGDWQASLANTEKMWQQGIPAIPTFHFGSPWHALIQMAKDYPKIALGGVAARTAKRKIDWAGQCFARVWPKKIHGFAYCSEKALMALPFHCMTDEHKVLTTDGWKGREEVRVGEKVLAFADGKSQWEEVTDLYEYQVENAPVTTFDNRTFSARVTPNHRWRVFNVRRKKWEWSTTDRLVNSDRISRRADYQAPKESIYEDWFVKLFAWYWTEGYVRAKGDINSSKITIAQSLTANPEKVNLIREALNESKEKYCEWSSHRLWPDRKQTEDNLVTFELYGHVRNKLLQMSPDKSIPINFLLQLTKEQLELFIRTSVAGDGWGIKRITTSDGFALWQKDGKNMEEFRIACLLGGYATSRYEGTGGANVYGVGVQVVSTEFITPKPCGRDEHYVNMRRKDISYSGHLWCIGVRSGAFFTKCNHHIYATGNSVDSTTWEVAPCKFGHWKAFGNQKVSVRGSKQNLRAEVEYYLDLERRVRAKWKKQMIELESLSPTIRLAVGTDRQAAVVRALLAPTVRLAESGTTGRVETKAAALGKKDE